MADQIVIFVHGWSVTDTETYGGLPERLRLEAALQGINIRVEEIFLGRYISFHDEVRLPDISRALQTALHDSPIAGALQGNRRFACITHSTGGPVVRDWWHRYYPGPEAGTCPLSHLIMLAPANYGSALAQLGKARLGRLKSWFGGVEPGQGVLDWLELGSDEAWRLNKAWIFGDGSRIGANGVFPFVLTGQSIDREFYDNLNTYTGEMGSDGVVRAATANLQGQYIKLAQEAPHLQDGELIAPELVFETPVIAPETAFRIVRGKSHSGDSKGIMRSVTADPAEEHNKETVDSILACLKVENAAAYTDLCATFRAETTTVQEEERLEVDEHLFLRPTYFFHDRCSMVIFRVLDDHGYPVTDFDLTLTVGPKNDANHLPEGFFIDRQRNHVHPEIITYFINTDVMLGCKPVKHGSKVIRKTSPGTKSLGFTIKARPEKGFVHYLPCKISASTELLQQIIRPNSTTMLDIRLRRIVHKAVFRADIPTSPHSGDFKDTKPGDEVVGE
jgi:hypothetical protein